MTPRQFRIQIEDGVLDDLRLRLHDARLTTPPGDAAGWEFGASPGYLKALVDHWLHRYDWRHHEARLNELPQFVADVAGANIHFVHQRAAAPSSTPLLLLHGWPDSFYRYHKVIPMLAAPERYGGDAADAFELVVPSLPGFGFTGPVRRPSAEQPTRQSAELLWRLMTEVLGHERFAVAGGDGGSALAQILAIDHPDSVIGIHLTDLGWHVANVDASKLPKKEQKYLEAGKKRFMQDGAYAMVQATRPRSLAPALNDSPVGLAAWIVDRFHSWRDGGAGDLEASFSRDDLLTNIMIYWVTQTIGSSMNSYYADARSPSLSTDDYVEVPVGLALFPKDIGGIPPRTFAERTLNVRRWTEMPRGSHFAALEEPELFARDVTAFFRDLRAHRQEAREGGEHVPAVF
jgi:pimeloyl-ACP methyl ester carboxylesterase